MSYLINGFSPATAESTGVAMFSFGAAVALPAIKMGAQAIASFAKTCFEDDLLGADESLPVQSHFSASQNPEISSSQNPDNNWADANRKLEELAAKYAAQRKGQAAPTVHPTAPSVFTSSVRSLPLQKPAPFDDECSEESLIPKIAIAAGAVILCVKAFTKMASKPSIAPIPTKIVQTPWLKSLGFTNRNLALAAVAGLIFKSPILRLVKWMDRQNSEF